MQTNTVAISISEEGIEFSTLRSNEGTLRDETSDDASRELTSFLIQLMDDGYAFQRSQDTLVPWDRLYALLSAPEYSASVALLRLPPMENWIPILREHGSLSDPDFRIMIAGWIGPDGKKFHGTPNIVGGKITASSPAILSKDSWCTVTEVKEFWQRSTESRDLRGNQLGWARIRKAALAAKADLSEYLSQTMVVTADHLTINLRRNASQGVIEVIPCFEGQPQEWLLSYFDRLSLRERYDVASGDDACDFYFGSTKCSQGN
jgi:hypothetical protein